MFFEEERFSARAKGMLAQIERRAVVTFAPDMLIYEFMNRASEKATGRDGKRDREEAAGAYFALLELPISYDNYGMLTGDKWDAWELMTTHHLSAFDSWYLACAIKRDAELWISHEHSDGFVEKAARLHRGKVFTLERSPFSQPDPVPLA